MITTIAICACLILSLLQKTRDNFISASIFSITAIVYDIASDNVPDDYYYLSASFLAFLCSYLITSFNCKSELSAIISDFCIVSIIINIIGFCIYMANMSPIVYNNAFFVFYLLLIAALIMKGDRDAVGGGFQFYKWRHFRSSLFNRKNHPVYSYTNKCNQVQKYHQETK